MLIDLCITPLQEAVRGYPNPPDGGRVSPTPLAVTLMTEQCLQRHPEAGSSSWSKASQLWSSDAPRPYESVRGAVFINVWRFSLQEAALIRPPPMEAVSASSFWP